MISEALSSLSLGLPFLHSLPLSPQPPSCSSPQQLSLSKGLYTGMSTVPSA